MLLSSRALGLGPCLGLLRFDCLRTAENYSHSQSHTAGRCRSSGPDRPCLLFREANSSPAKNRRRLVGSTSYEDAYRTRLLLGAGDSLRQIETGTSADPTARCACARPR